VRLWWDDDAALAQTPWAKANGVECRDNRIIFNSFLGDTVGVELQRSANTLYARNTIDESSEGLRIDGESKATMSAELTREVGEVPAAPEQTLPGVSKPLTARASFDGRENIVMTEWGPWDHESPLLQFVERRDGADTYRLLGALASQPANERIRATGDVRVDIDGENVRVSPRSLNTFAAYELAWTPAGGAPPLIAHGAIAGGFWTIKTFASPVDPRRDVEAWRKAAQGENVHTLDCDPLDLPFGNAGMTEIRGLPVPLPHNHFGIVATRALTFPKGRWRIDATSDDGIRVWLDDQMVIDDWTLHPPKRQSYEFEVVEAQREIALRVEYFELDGSATLQVSVAPAPE